MSRCWVFDETMLEAALAAYVRAGVTGLDGAEYPGSRESLEAEARAIREFLASPEAREYKLLMEVPGAPTPR